MRRILYSLLGIYLFSTCTAYAYSDFYGIKMKDPNCAKDFVMEKSGTEIPKYTLNTELMDDRVSASANLGYQFGAVKSVDIKVMNRSDKPIRTDLTFASVKLIATDDQEYEMVQPEIIQWPAVDMINPKDEATFVIPMVRLQIKKEEIKMIVCSFDMGETKIVLLPRPYEAEVKKTPAVQPKTAETIAPKTVSVQNFAKSRKETSAPRTFAPSVPAISKGTSSLSRSKTFINTGNGSKAIFVQDAK